MKKYYIVGVLVTFIVVFNLGYVFHDLLLGSWLHEKEAAVSREEYIIPVIALAFFIYSCILAYLLPIFHFYARTYYKWEIYKTAMVFGGLIGFLWDALQGGMIEYATFNIPVEVFLVDSSYHVFEGVYTSLLLAFFYSKYYKEAKI
ncbi:MAG: hypothetical protein O2887_17615 [Bacteroidetes bacterium]|nr:hypothetical protein [Bacteroidota bacterium]MDA1122275.1 hypothetical protein [Bacteroidota bacterium]